jgi:hypothetical protein
MRKLSDHLPASAMLNEQCVFAADLIAPRNVGYLDEQSGVCSLYWRNATIDDTLVIVNLCRCETHFIRVVVASFKNPRQDIAHFRLIIDELQQGFTIRSLLADTKNIFGGRVQANN